MTLALVEKSVPEGLELNFVKTEEEYFSTRTRGNQLNPTELTTEIHLSQLSESVAVLHVSAHLNIRQH